MGHSGEFMEQSLRWYLCEMITAYETDGVSRRRRDLEYLRVFSRLDLAICLALAASVSKIAPLAALALVLLPFLQGAFGNQRLGEATERDFRSRFGIPEKVLLRRSNKPDSYVFSMPLRSILFLAPDVSGGPHTSNNRGKIAHELGHIGEYDLPVLYIILLACTSWLAVSLLHFGRLLFGGIEDYQGQQDLQLTGIAWAILLLLCTTAGLATAHRVAHRREHIADLAASVENNGDLLAFLSQGALEERYRKAKSALGRLNNRFAHPAKTVRLRIVTDGYERAARQVGRYGMIWSVSVGIFMILAALPFAPSAQPAPFMRVLPLVLSGMALVVAAGLAGSAADRLRALAKIDQRPYAAAFLSAVALGFVLVVWGFMALEYFAFGVTEFGSATYLAAPAFGVGLWAAGVWINTAVFGWTGLPNLFAAVSSAALFLISAVLGFFFLSEPVQSLPRSEGVRLLAGSIAITVYWAIGLVITTLVSLAVSWLLNRRSEPAAD